MDEQAQPLGAVTPESPATLPDPPSYRLFTPDQVGGASFCGSALAGGLMLWLNSRKLKDGKGGVSLLVSIVLTGLTLAIAFAVPEGFPGVILGGAALGAMRAYTQIVQGTAIAEHVRAGGRKGSIGVAILLVLLSCGLLLGGAFAAFYATLPPSFHLGKDEVIYQAGAQESEARSLAEELKKLGYFDGSGASVYLSKPDGKFHLGFVVKDGAWDSSESCDAFRTLSSGLSESAFHSTPAVMELVNADGEVKKSL